MRQIVFALAILQLGAQLALAENFSDIAARNWHQWRGPNGDGVSDSANPPIEWSETKNIKWKVEIPGKGTATPIIWGDHVFVLSAIKTDRQKEGTQVAAQTESPRQEQPQGRRGGRSGRRGFGFGAPAPTNHYQFVVICFDRKTGKQMWQTVATEEVPHEAGHETNTFASASPTTDGQFVYASFGSRGIYCFDMEGNLQWDCDFGEMRTAARFGEGSSPALRDDTLVVPWDHEGDSFIVALDAKTGKEKWKVDREEGTTWATPFIVDYDGRTQVVMHGRQVRSYDFATGELIWECGGQASNPIATPVVHDGLVFCMTGHRGFAIYAIPLSARGDITDSGTIAWHTKEAGPYVLSPVVYKGQLYFTKARNGVLLSRDAKTGEPLIDETRLPGIDQLYASAVAAADRIYLTGRSGTTLVLKHGHEFDVLASNTLDEGIDASAALVDNELFLRGESHLYCVAVE